MLSDIEIKTLKEMGLRLKNARLKRNDPQKEFAFRIKVSIPTLHKMEQGSPSVAIGTWIKALSKLGILKNFNELIPPEKSLFKKYESLKKTNARQRARRKI